ncbi:MAG: hypothetical protein MJ250_03655 [Alphaproteobacteria bacterium]|nr:hypothetical protein [Alphaproteobacteria bacterium]
MLKVIWKALVLLFWAFVASWFANHPGFIRIEWIGWQVETSVAVLLLVLILIYFVGYQLIAKPIIFLGIKFSERLILKKKAEKLADGKLEIFNRKLDILNQGMIAVNGKDLETAVHYEGDILELYQDNLSATYLYQAKLAELRQDNEKALSFYDLMLADKDLAKVGFNGKIELMKKMEQDIAPVVEEAFKNKIISKKQYKSFKTEA